MELLGRVEKITFRSNDNSFHVIKITESRSGNTVTLVGDLASVSVGDIIRVVGRWDEHPKYGARFMVEDYQLELPSNIEAVEQYLASGAIKGIGPATAKRITERFKDQALEIIEHDPDQLLGIKGISRRKLAEITGSWARQKEAKGLLLFLKTHGLSINLAKRLMEHYGRNAIGILRENPYRLAFDIPGIGFLKADEVASRLGIPKDSPERVKAGVAYALSKTVEEGHSFYPKEALKNQASLILKVNPELIDGAISALKEEGYLVEKEIMDREGEKTQGIYLSYLFHSEIYVANRIRQTIRTRAQGQGVKKGQLICGDMDINLTEEQREAIRKAFEEKFSLITGGPGTGKTTLLRYITSASRVLNKKILLAAPTGRAAKRMMEATGHEAKTIHRLLGWNPEIGSFSHNERNPLKADFIVVDEASMIDIMLMASLFRAIPLGAHIVLVGDKDQLPPVGPGSPFAELVEADEIKVTRLGTVFRQREDGLLILNAHRVNQGLFPIIREGTLSDFHFFYEEDPHRIHDLIVDLATKKLPSTFGLSPMEDIQVMSPMRKGILGVENLASTLQDLLNPRGRKIESGTKALRVGDRVMQIKNNYEKDVYNGDIGKILEFDGDKVIVGFDEREVSYDVSELDELVLAYCTSIHKSQGSEFPAVVFPVTSHHYPLLQRNLIYTAITRAKRLAVIVGTKKALAMAIKNDRPIKRYSGLWNWLRGGE